MVGALAAAHGGRRVLVVDPFMDQPNNLAISGGLFPAAGSALQAQSGVSDSPDQWLADLRIYAGDSVNERIAVPVAQALPAVVDFLSQALHVPFGFLPDVVSSGHSQCRFHSTLPASGAALHKGLRQQVNQHPGITVWSRACTPEREASGFAIGDGQRRVTTPHVLLAGGGFGANAAWVAQHFPAMRGAL